MVGLFEGFRAFAGPLLCGTAPAWPDRQASPSSAPVAVPKTETSGPPAVLGDQQAVYASLTSPARGICPSFVQVSVSQGPYYAAVSMSEVILSPKKSDAISLGI